MDIVRSIVEYEILLKITRTSYQTRSTGNTDRSVGRITVRGKRNGDEVKTDRYDDDEVFLKEDSDDDCEQKTYETTDVSRSLLIRLPILTATNCFSLRSRSDERTELFFRFVSNEIIVSSYFYVSRSSTGLATTLLFQADVTTMGHVDSK